MAKDSVPIGSTAVRLGYLESSELAKAITEQGEREKEKGQHVILGMLMVEMGLLTNDQLTSVLNKQNVLNALPVSEDAMRLATRFRAILSDQQKVLLFCSCQEQEGVSSVTAGVAIALSMMGLGNVLMIDANMRSRRRGDKSLAHDAFGIEKGKGLSELLDGSATFDEVVQTTSMATFSIMPVGNEEGDLLPLLISGAYSRQMQELRERFAFILLDAPPLLMYPDSGLLAADADGVVLVIASGERNQDEVIEAKRIFDGLNIEVLGAVMTEMTRKKLTRKG